MQSHLFKVSAFLEQSPSSEVHHRHRVCVNLVE